MGREKHRICAGILDWLDTGRQDRWEEELQIILKYLQEAELKE